MLTYLTIYVNLFLAAGIFSHALRPQFHWTDQKIAVHYFMCVLGYLMSAIVLREAKTKNGFKGSMDTLLDILNNIRLAACISQSAKRGRYDVAYQLEEIEEQHIPIAQALGILDAHINRPELQDVSVYTSSHS
jgi:Ni/Fe-hydrogenase subunit HybB-like protein